MKQAFGIDVPQTLDDVCDRSRLALVGYDMQAGIVLDGGLESLPFLEHRFEVEVLGVTLDEQIQRVQAVGVEQRGLVVDLGFGNTAD